MKTNQNKGSTQGGEALLTPRQRMELLCGVANARYALEYWSREAAICGDNANWLAGPIQRGRHEIETLRELEALIRPPALAQPSAES